MRSFLLWGVSLTNRVLTPQQKAQATGSRAREAGKRAALRVRPAGLSSEPGPRASCRLLSVRRAGSSLCVVLAPRRSGSSLPAQSAFTVLETLGSALTVAVPPVL